MDTRKCGKPVYFAERKTSMGYEWHPECLRCEECGKRLNPGQHAEHKGVPYCHVPCYSVLFGPTLFGHGSQVEAHTSFGKNTKDRQCVSSVPRNHLEGKLKVYNQYYEGKSGIVQSRLRNGRLILEGSIRIFWGVNQVIRLKEDHDDRIPVRRRRTSLRLSRLAINSKDRGSKYLQNGSPEKESGGSMENGTEGKNGGLRMSASTDNMVAEVQLSDPECSESHTNGSSSEIGRSYRTLPNPGKHSLSDLLADTSAQQQSLACEDANGFEGVTLRSKARSSRVKLRRRCSINGHFYNRETSVFTPAYGSVTSVWVTSLVNAPEVINQLLDKFKVENSPQDFALYVVRDTGERRLMQDDEYPLLARVMLGPDEAVAKLFIMNRENTNEIPYEVAQYLNFSEVELTTFIKKFHEEEDREVEKIKNKFKTLRHRIQTRMQELKSIPVKINS
ncbi:ras association domain-containing protein 2 isoform X2 [Dermacentor albipictus]|uniref:ras association domain-containing protein 2 isoform X2 n=1 Tax=Dermacentor albipictus TaxID=60249 RepID=UPI0031FC2C50